jgi:hypothetical protein
MCKYTAWYNALVSKPDTELISGFETHHKIPKCVGGTNEETNLVKLSTRKHFIAHWLLTKIYKDNSKLLFAFAQMAVNNKYQNRRFTSRMYEVAKAARSKAMKIWWTDMSEDDKNRIASKKATSRKKSNANLGKEELQKRNEFLNSISPRKTWQLISPNGVITITTQLQKLAKELNLSYNCLTYVASGKMKHHKGYICSKIIQERGTPN